MTRAVGAKAPYHCPRCHTIVTQAIRAYLVHLGACDEQFCGESK